MSWLFIFMLNVDSSKELSNFVERRVIINYLLLFWIASIAVTLTNWFQLVAIFHSIWLFHFHRFSSILKAIVPNILIFKKELIKLLFRSRLYMEIEIRNPKKSTRKFGNPAYVTYFIYVYTSYFLCLHRKEIALKLIT